MNETISSHYKLLKQKLKLPDEACEERGAGSEGGAMVKEQMRRALHFMTLGPLGRNAGSDGGGSEGRYEHSSHANSQRGGGGSLGGGSERRQGGGHGGFSSAPSSSLGSDKPAPAPGEAGLDAAALHKLKKRQVHMPTSRLVRAASRPGPRARDAAARLCTPLAMLPRASTHPSRMPAQELCGEDVLTWAGGGRPRSWCRCGDTRT
jgi:hypothetical protein